MEKIKQKQANKQDFSDLLGNMMGNQQNNSLNSLKNSQKPLNSLNSKVNNQPFGQNGNLSMGQQGNLSMGQQGIQPMGQQGIQPIGQQGIQPIGQNSSNQYKPLNSLMSTKNVPIGNLQNIQQNPPIKPARQHNEEIKSQKNATESKTKNDIDWGNIDFLANNSNQKASSNAVDVFDLEFLQKPNIVQNDDDMLGLLGKPIKVVNQSTPKPASVSSASQNQDKSIQNLSSSPSSKSAVNTPESSVNQQPTIQISDIRNSPRLSDVSVSSSNNSQPVPTSAKSELFSSAKVSSPHKHPQQSIDQIKSMGFDNVAATRSLDYSNGDVSLAVEYLISGKYAQDESMSTKANNRRKSGTINSESIIKTASSLGTSVFKNAKNMFEFSKRKIASTLENASVRPSTPTEIEMGSESSLHYSAYHQPYSDNPVDKTSEFKDKQIINAEQPRFNTKEKSPSKLQSECLETEVNLIDTGNDDQTFTSLNYKSVQKNEVKDQVNNKNGSDKKVDYIFSSKNEETIKGEKEEAYAEPSVREESLRLKELGNDSYKRGQFEEAVEYYNKALILLPTGHLDTANILNNRSGALLKTGEYKKCVEDCTAVQALDFQNVKSLLRRAAAYEALENFKMAQQDYKLVMGIQPDKSVSISLARCGQGIINKPSIREDVTFTTTHKKNEKLSSATQARIDKQVDTAVSELRDKLKKEDKEQDLAFSLKSKVDQQIETWSKGKEKNIRALLSSLDLVLWPQLNWKPINLGNLITNAQVKKEYMKAVGKVHPDKVTKFNKISSNAEMQHRMIASSVFSILNDAFDAFKLQNGN